MCVSVACPGCAASLLASKQSNKDGGGGISASDRYRCTRQDRPRCGPASSPGVSAGWLISELRGRRDEIGDYAVCTQYGYFGRHPGPNVAPAYPPRSGDVEMTRRRK